MPSPRMGRVFTITIAVLLFPTAYAMARQEWLLAGGCVAGILLARFIGLRRDDGEDTR